MIDTRLTALLTPGGPLAPGGNTYVNEHCRTPVTIQQQVIDLPLGVISLLKVTTFCKVLKMLKKNGQNCTKI
jgi:hypothetical protein